MIRPYRILLLVFLSLMLLSNTALARERFRINVRADVEEENVGVEFKYNLSYKLYIDGGLGIDVTGPINRGRISIGFRYYLQDPDEKLYLRIRGITNFEDATITRFRVGLGVGYTAYVSRNRSSVELGVIIGSNNGTLEIKPSLGVSVSVGR